MYIYELQNITAILYWFNIWHRPVRELCAPDMIDQNYFIMRGPYHA